MAQDVQRKVREILRLLESRHGKKRRPSSLPLLDQVMLALLAEQGSKARAKRAHQKLLQSFVGWNEVRVSSGQEIAEFLRPIYRDRAPALGERLRAFLNDLYVAQHQLSLDYLGDLPLETSFKLLSKLPPMNEEARACVVNGSLANPDVAMPADALRVAKRIGLVGAGATSVKAREVFQEELKSSDQARLNLLLYQHGLEVCTAKTYDCLSCVLVHRCDRGKEKKAEARLQGADGRTGAGRRGALKRGRAAGSPAGRRGKAPRAVRSSPARKRGGSFSKESAHVETPDRGSMKAYAAGKSSAGKSGAKKKGTAKRATAKKGGAKKTAKKKVTARKR